MPQKRLLGSAAVLTSGVAAGIIESSSGSASVTPMPRWKVRRGRYFFVMNDMIRSLSARPEARALRLHLHLERCALGDAENQIRETIAVLRRVAHQRAHGRHVVVLRLASDAVHHQLLGQRRDEDILAIEQRLTQARRTVDGRAV